MTMLLRCLVLSGLIAYCASAAPSLTLLWRERHPGVLDEAWLLTTGTLEEEEVITLWRRTCGVVRPARFCRIAVAEQERDLHNQYSGKYVMLPNYKIWRDVRDRFPRWPRGALAEVSQIGKHAILRIAGPQRPPRLRLLTSSDPLEIRQGEIILKIAHICLLTGSTLTVVPPRNEFEIFASVPEEASIMQITNAVRVLVGRMSLIRANVFVAGEPWFIEHPHYPVFNYFWNEPDRIPSDIVPNRAVCFVEGRNTKCIDARTP